MKTATTNVTENTIVFIDATVTHLDQLLAGLQPGTEVVILDPTRDGIDQITQALAGRSQIASLQILSHGDAGRFWLGNRELSETTIETYQAQLQQWQSALTPDADLLLYGCNVAATASGQSLIDRLSVLTGADVAASTNWTGAAGDWQLEATTGPIDSSLSLSSAAAQAYSGTLNVITVTSTADSGAGSLRAAIANAPPGSTIRFTSALANQTITLASPIEVAVGKNLVIDGSDATNLTISGNNATRLFVLRSTSVNPTSLTVKQLTLANAYTAERGGAILTEHQGKLTIDQVTFRNNVADQGGGAIFSAFEGALTVTNSRFIGNKAIAANDERGAGAIAFYGPGTLTVKGSEFRENKGINGAAINSLNGKLIVEDSVFVNNDTNAAVKATGQPNDFLRGYGGAIYTDRANNEIAIRRSVFEGNSSRASGGAVHLFADPEDDVTIESSLFRNNQATGLPGGVDNGKGGAITHLRNATNAAGKFVLDRVTIANNTGYDQGGGLWVNQSKTTITNSTISGNQVVGTGSSIVGGGMALYSDTDIINTTIANNVAGWVGGGVSVSNEATVTAKNTIFYNNTANNGGNDWKIQQQTNRELVDRGGNLQFPDWQSNQFNRFNDNRATATIRIADPKLGPLQDNGSGLPTHALLAGSPAINSGVNNGAPAIDQRGFRRGDGQTDSGAFEAGATAPSNTDPVLPPVSPPPPSDNPAIVPITGGTTADRLLGTGQQDILSGGLGNDTLIGGGNSDTLTGGEGADYFTYSGATQRAAFAQSRLSQRDRITDWDVTDGDRIQLDFDNNLATTERPRRLFNAGTVNGKNLSQATQAAYGDKHQRRAGNQPLKANEAVLFQWRKRLYLGINDAGNGFNPKRDLLLEVTGLTQPAGDAIAGVLPVNRYFG